MKLINLKILYFFIFLLIFFITFISKFSIAYEEINIIADKIISNKLENTINASGDVVVIDKEGLKLSSEKAEYNKELNRLIASDEVIINDEYGNTFFFENIEAINGLKNISGNDVKVRLYDGSRIVGKNLVKDENISVLNDAEYTPCKENNYLIENCPGWKLKSKRIYRDDTKKTIYYDHAKLHLFNIPILYLPHFSHPDPSVNKRTGFLMPTIQTDNNLGEQLSIPYFINFSGNNDLTFTPNFQSKANNFYFVNYRYLNRLGKFNLDASIDDNDDGKGTRNHIFFDANIFNDYGKLNLALKTSNNDTYLRKNKINQLTVHESGINFKRDTSDSYLSAKSSSFKHLTIQGDNQWEYIYPKIEFNIKNISLKNSKNRFSLNNDFSYQKKLNESYATLAASDLIWSDTNINKKYGLLFNNKANFRLVSIFNDNKNSKDEDNIRFYPQISSKITYPLFKITENSNQTLTPIFMPIIAPYNNYTGHKAITNSNLFSSNRASSLTESESGPRINYGFEWFLEHKNNYDLKISVGQSKRFNKNKDDSNEETSDIYLSSNLIIDNNKYLNNSIIIDKDNKDLKTNNANLLLALDKFSLGIDYDYNSGKYFNASEQIRIGSKFEIMKNIEFNLNAAKNIDKNKNIGYQYGLLYENDCLGIDLNYFRDLTKDRDVAESYGYSFTIVLKPFGTTKKYGKTKVFGPRV